MSHFHSGEQRLQDSLQKLGQQNCPSLEWMRKCGIFLQAHVRRHRKAKCHYLVRHSKHLDASCFPFGFAMLKALQAAESGSLAYCFDDASPDAFPRLWRVSRLGEIPTRRGGLNGKDWLEQRMPWEQQTKRCDMTRCVSLKVLNVLKSEST